MLNGLSDDAYLQLRKAGALAIAYAQLLSMARFAVFQQLVKLQVQLAQIAAAQPPKTPAGLPESLDQLFGIASDDTIRIG